MGGGGIAAALFLLERTVPKWATTIAARIGISNGATVPNAATIISSRVAIHGSAWVVLQRGKASFLATWEGNIVIESSRRPKKPTALDWSREKYLVKERPGVHAWRIVYFVKWDDFTFLNVYRQGGYWKWYALSTSPRVIVGKGDAPTMHEAKLRAEAAMFGADKPQQTIWDGKHGTNTSEIPF